MNDYIADQLLDSARNRYHDDELRQSVHKILQYLEHRHDQESRPDINEIGETLEEELTRKNQYIVDLEELVEDQRKTIEELQEQLMFHQMKD